MRKTDIEFWALNVIECVENGQLVEDDRVELKSTLIDPAKAARRIAGHANAARGEPILWLFGVDETDGVKGVSYNDYAEWFGKVQSNFNEISPDAVSINIPYKGITILAILFDTDRAPYLVKNPSGGTVQFEVPWRDNTTIKTANRSELLKILVPAQKLPMINVLSGNLSVYQHQNEKTWDWFLELHLYVESMLNYPAVIPFHQSVVTFCLEDVFDDVEFKEIKLLPPPLPSGLTFYSRPLGSSDSQPPRRPQYDSITIDGTSTELMIQGPGRFKLTATSFTDPVEGNIVDTKAIIKANLKPIDNDRIIHLKADLTWIDKDPKVTDLKGVWDVRL